MCIKDVSQVKKEALNANFIPNLDGKMRVARRIYGSSKRGMVQGEKLIRQVTPGATCRNKQHECRLPSCIQGNRLTEVGQIKKPGINQAASVHSGTSGARAHPRPNYPDARNTGLSGKPVQDEA